MNQKELNHVSALVERRMALRELLKAWDTQPVPAAPTAEQRRAVRQLVEERTEEYRRLEEVFRRLSDQLDKLESRIEESRDDEASTARVRRLQRDLRVVGEDIRRLRDVFRPATPGEAQSALLVDPYIEDSAPIAQRVRVPEGDL